MASANSCGEMQTENIDAGAVSASTGAAVFMVGLQRVQSCAGRSLLLRAAFYVPVAAADRLHNSPDVS